MKKTGKTNKKRKMTDKKTRSDTNNHAKINLGFSGNRRRFLRNIAIAFPILAVGIYFSVSAIQATLGEADLSKIGNGRPAIVQIHDPQCNLCRALQKQTRNILSAYDDETYEFMVANIKTSKGNEIALRYMVPHVTLLLFDPKGKMVQSVRGPLSDASLRGYIAVHLERFKTNS